MKKIVFLFLVTLSCQSVFSQLSKEQTRKLLCTTDSAMCVAHTALLNCFITWDDKNYENSIKLIEASMKSFKLLAKKGNLDDKAKTKNFVKQMEATVKICKSEIALFDKTFVRFMKSEGPRKQYTYNGVTYQVSKYNEADFLYLAPKGGDGFCNDFQNLKLISAD